VIALSPDRLPKTLWTDKQGGAKPLLVTVGEETEQARYVAGRVLANREAGASLKSFRRARTGADPPQHPLRQIRRAQISRRGACEGRVGAAQIG
jgi:hypothetical protein